jgi:hypothetical protein
VGEDALGAVQEVVWGLVVSESEHVGEEQEDMEGEDIEVPSSSAVGVGQSDRGQRDTSMDEGKDVDLAVV